MHARKLLTTLFEYKAWANRDLFRLLQAQPTDQHPDEMRLATRLMNHIYVVDRIFEANLQGLQHGYTGLNTPETPLLADLHAAVQQLDQWFLDYVATLSEEAISEVVEFIFVDGKPGHMSRGEMLMHLVTHGNYHRGAVGRILAQLDVAPPRDTLTVFLHGAVEAPS